MIKQKKRQPDTHIYIYIYINTYIWKKNKCTKITRGPNNAQS